MALLCFHSLFGWYRTRHVIIGVLLMMIVIPLLTLTGSGIDTSNQYAAAMVHGKAVAYTRFPDEPQVKVSLFYTGFNGGCKSLAVPLQSLSFSLFFPSFVGVLFLGSCLLFFFLSLLSRIWFYFLLTTGKRRDAVLTQKDCLYKTCVWFFIPSIFLFCDQEAFDYALKGILLKRPGVLLYQIDDKVFVSLFRCCLASGAHR